MERVVGRQRTRKALAAAVLLSVLPALVLLTLSGCRATAPGSPEQILNRSLAAQNSLKSFKFELDFNFSMSGPHTGGKTSSGYYRMEGCYSKPSRTRVTVRNSAGETEIITIGDRSWKKAPGSGTWVEQKTVESKDAPVDVKEFLRYSKKLQLLETTGDTYHLRFKRDIGRYSKNFGVPGIDESVFKGMDADMDVWVLKDSYHVKRAKMEFSGDLSKVGAGSVKVSMDLDLSEIDEPVTIEPPA